MKDFKIDTVQVVGLLGGAFAVVGSMLTNYANDKKLDEVVNEKVAKAIAEQLANLNRGE
ncbi:MAG: hypothetical protein PUD99_03830 [Turicibacter sp.]|nr:hypothetical protein [Turicibacter sp.]